MKIKKKKENMFKQIEEVKSTKRIKEDEKIKKKQRNKYVFCVE